jgi:hypothetical protein
LGWMSPTPWMRIRIQKPDECGSNADPDPKHCMEQLKRKQMLIGSPHKSSLTEHTPYLCEREKEAPG